MKEILCIESYFIINVHKLKIFIIKLILEFYIYGTWKFVKSILFLMIEITFQNLHKLLQKISSNYYFTDPNIQPQTNHK